MNSDPAARFSVPVCPSTNNLFVDRRDGKGRAKSSVYKAWITEAGWLVKRARPQAVHGPVAVWMEMPFNRRRDIDNGAKAVLDLLVSQQLIDGDNWVDRLLIRRAPERKDIGVEIWPYP